MTLGSEWEYTCIQWEIRIECYACMGEKRLHHDSREYYSSTSSLPEHGIVMSNISFGLGVQICTSGMNINYLSDFVNYLLVNQQYRSFLIVKLFTKLQLNTLLSTLTLLCCLFNLL